jgi:hypothetical protein
VGCDSVFGLDDPTLPKCTTVSFDTVTGSPVRPEPVEFFSVAVSGSRTLVVYTSDSQPFEQTDSATPVSFSFDPPYNMVSLALDPDEPAMFVTAAIEPEEIFSVRRGSVGMWMFEGTKPPGSIAGTPSSARLGAQHVVVRVSPHREEFQEYELDAGRWQPVGDVFRLAAIGGANLTPSGLVVVYEGVEGGERGVYIAVRGSIDHVFEKPQRILAGEHRAPQLVADCSMLYAIDPATNTLERFAR